MSVTVKRPKTRPVRAKARILGERTFAAITAVEGVRLSAESKKRLHALKRRGLSHDERRAEIIRAYSHPKKR